MVYTSCSCQGPGTNQVRGAMHKCDTSKHAYACSKDGNSKNHSIPFFFRLSLHRQWIDKIFRLHPSVLFSNFCIRKNKLRPNASTRPHDVLQTSFTWTPCLGSPSNILNIFTLKSTLKDQTKEIIFHVEICEFIAWFINKRKINTYALL